MKKRTAITMDTDHKHFGISVGKFLTLTNLLTDNTFIYGWDPLINIPTKSTGVIAGTPTTLANGETVMNANFSKPGPLPIKNTEVLFENI